MTVAPPEDASRVPHPSMSPRLRLVVAFAVVGLLAQMAGAMVLSGWDEAPTNDEPAHIGAGVAYVYDRDLRWAPEHPPFARAVSALALRVSGVQVEPATIRALTFDEYELGRRTLFDGVGDSSRRLLIARVPSMLLTLLFGLALFFFARSLFGAVPALLPLGLYAADPNFIAHGHLVTTDVPAAGFLLMGVWLAWRARAGGIGLVAASGVTLGMALLSKGLSLLLAPLLVVVVAESAFRSGGARRRMVGWPLALAGVAVATVWTGYLIVDPSLAFDRVLAGATEATGPLRRVADLLPFPEPYREGLKDLVLIDQSGSRSFLLGDRYTGGRAAFYPVVLAAKSPLASLALLATGVFAVLWSRRRAELAMYVLFVPACAFLVAASSSTNLGVRHVLVVPLFLFVAAGAVSAHPRWPPLATVVAIMVLLAVSWSTFPAHLSYVNSAFGGMDKGPKILSDSNVDWGQDLKRLAERLDNEPPSKPPWLLYFGSARPEAYGIVSQDVLTAAPESVHGTVYASVTALNSFYGDRFDWLRNGHEPVGRVGSSILVYEVP